MYELTNSKVNVITTFMKKGVTFPAVNSMISRWIPNSERTTIGSFILAGTI